MALLLAVTVVHLPARSIGPVLVAAGALASLAALTHGPLGAWKLISPSTHRVLDGALVIVLVAAPLVAHFDDLLLVLLSEGLALAMAVLVRRTAYSSSRSRRQRQAPLRTVTGQPQQWTRALRSAGFILGRARRDGPQPLGRLVSRYRKS
ncbi:MAG: hypothetical protein M3256_20935 [Actinomycetota bacterium]|nr:hypothetical protein [Actinomycetota bacterium]